MFVLFGENYAAQYITERQAAESVCADPKNQDA
jgi:hypothetical protein